jgi:glycosyltransferase involved in cell wall biosynthesis
VDNDRFLSLCQATRSRLPAERTALGLGDRKVVLFVGRMLERKGAQYLLEAAAAIRRGGLDLTVLLVGDGPMRATWERRAQTLLPGAVRFLGSRALDDLPLFYQLADLFVLPSVEEVWGLVVNEAALAGLPLIVSDSCGGGPRSRRARAQRVPRAAGRCARLAKRD